MTPRHTKKSLAKSGFIPCKSAVPLIEPELEAAYNKRPGGAEKKRKTCSRFKMTRNDKSLGLKLCAKVKSISRGGAKGNPYVMRSFRHVQMTMPKITESRENFASGDLQIIAPNPSQLTSLILAVKPSVPTIHD